MNLFSSVFTLAQKPIAHITDEYRRRTLILGMIAISASLFTGITDLMWHLAISATLDFLLAISFTVLFILDYKEWNFNAKVAYLLVFNFFVVLEVFAEGLATATYLFFFVGIVSMAFMLDNNGKSDPNIRYYLLFIVICFIGCIYFAPEKSSYEFISTSLAREMFITNCITVVTLISVFTYVGVRMEKEVRSALLNQKNMVEAHEAKILVQNNHLREIAFMSAHSLRSPLTNVMSISNLINVDAITSERDKLLIQHLKQTSLELDKVIHDIVGKTTSAMGEEDSDFII